MRFSQVSATGGYLNNLAPPVTNGVLADPHRLVGNGLSVNRKTRRHRFNRRKA